MNKGWLRTNLTRRELLALLMVGIYPTRCLASSSVIQPSNNEVIKSFVDTLIPADDITPAGSELGVDRLIMDTARTDKMYNRFLQTGCRWLNRYSGGDFTTMQQHQKAAVIEWMEHSNKFKLPWNFFIRIRNDAMSHYYSNPKSWSGIDIEYPPQPLGYMDFNR